MAGPGFGAWPMVAVDEFGDVPCLLIGQAAGLIEGHVGFDKSGGHFHLGHSGPHVVGLWSPEWWIGIASLHQESLAVALVAGGAIFRKRVAAAADVGCQSRRREKFVSAARKVGTYLGTGGQPRGIAGQGGDDFTVSRWSLAASRLAPQSDYAVVKVVSRGTHVHIVGSTPSFYVIQPPHGARVYVLEKFVTSAGADAQYLAPKLQMPAGFKGSTLAASLAAGTSAVLSSSTAKTSASVTTQPGSTSLPPAQTVPLPVSGLNSGQSGNTAVVPPSASGGAMSKSAQVSLFSKFADLNKQTQLEFQKPLMQRQLQPLLHGYEQLAVVAGAPTWIKQGVAARIHLLKRDIAIQSLVASAHKTPPVSQVIAPYQQQWKQSQKQIAQALDHAPYLAKGVLRTSTALKSKYALVNPANGRVTAYIDPTSRIALSRLLGEYIGVKGVVTGGGTVVKVIRVATATLLPQPRLRHLSAPQHHP